MEGLKWLLIAAFLAVILVAGITSVPSAPLTTEMERTTKANGLEITTLPPITVIYGEASRRIEAGEYYWRHDSIVTAPGFSIAPFFLTDKTGEARLCPALVRFDRRMTGDEVIAELDANGLRPGDFDELLAFGIWYPDQVKVGIFHPISALGSATTFDGFFEGQRLVPCLEQVEDLSVKMDVQDLEMWFAGYYFLAFPKEVGE